MNQFNEIKNIIKLNKNDDDTADMIVEFLEKSGEMKNIEQLENKKTNIIIYADGFHLIYYDKNHDFCIIRYDYDMFNCDLFAELADMWEIMINTYDKKRLGEYYIFRDRTNNYIRDLQPLEHYEPDSVGHEYTKWIDMNFSDIMEESVFVINRIANAEKISAGKCDSIILLKDRPFYMTISIDRVSIGFIKN